jgi:ADP-ribose pyrophosphatase YjhB (NUDIX family)
MPDGNLVLELARFIERVSAIARTGLAFAPPSFDTERYEELLRQAAAIKTTLAQDVDCNAEALYREWRETVASGYDGYVTAAVGCGAIVFNDRDEILMIQRPSGRWWYPTGFCDVGVSPAENVAREVREETGLIVTPIRLLGVLDSFKLGVAARHIYSILFECRLEGGSLKRIRPRLAPPAFSRSTSCPNRCMARIVDGSRSRASSTSRAGSPPISIRCDSYKSGRVRNRC